MASIVLLKRAHFFSLDNDIIDVHARTIGGNGVAVYAALARHANRTTGECWPSIGKLAHLLDMARNTVKAALRKLEAVGLIAIKRRRETLQGSPRAICTRCWTAPPRLLRHGWHSATRQPSPPEKGVGQQLISPPPSAADLPPSAADLRGRSTIDQEPDLSLEPEEENQATRSGADETPLKTSGRNPCPHPVEERSYFGNEAVICRHCWARLDTDLLPEAGRPPEAPREGTAAADAA